MLLQWDAHLDASQVAVAFHDTLPRSLTLLSLSLSDFLFPLAITASFSLHVASGTRSTCHAQLWCTAGAAKPLASHVGQCGSAAPRGGIHVGCHSAWLLHNADISGNTLPVQSAQQVGHIHISFYAPQLINVLSFYSSLQPWLVTLQGRQFLTKLSVLDLDPKPDSHFHKFIKQTQEIEKCCRALS